MKLNKLFNKSKIKVGNTVKTVIDGTTFYTIITEIKFGRVYGHWTSNKKNLHLKNGIGCIDLKECEYYEIK